MTMISTYHTNETQTMMKEAGKKVHSTVCWTRDLWVGLISNNSYSLSGKEM